jgi:hypothetical protein
MGEEGRKSLQLWTIAANIQDTVRIDLTKIGCKDGRWLKLVQDHVQQWALVLAVLNLPLLLPELVIIIL